MVERSVKIKVTPACDVEEREEEEEEKLLERKRAYQMMRSTVQELLFKRDGIWLEPSLKIRLTPVV